MRFPRSFGEFRFWLLRQLPLFDYICPACKEKVEENQHICHNCGEAIKVPVRVPPKVLKDKKALSDYVHKYIMTHLTPKQYAYLAKWFTTIFSDGFESGDTSAWSTKQGTCTVVNTLSHHGTYSLYATVTGYVGKSFTATTTVFVRGYFRLDAAPAGSNIIMRLSDSIWGTTIADFGVGATTITWGGYSYTVTLNANQWYCFEAKFVKSATVGEYRVWIDGVEIITQTGLDTSAKVTPAYFKAGFVYAGTGGDIYFDCAVIADAYIGPEYPFGAGLFLAKTHRTLGV